VTGSGVVAVAVAVTVLLGGRPILRLPGPPPAGRYPGDVLAALGGTLRRWLGRPGGGADGGTDRVWGLAVVVALLLVLVQPPLSPIGIGVVIGAERLRHRRARQRHRAALEAEAPEVLELVAVAIRAGGTPSAALALVAERGPPHTATILGRVLATALAGRPLVEALDVLVADGGEGMRPLAAALVSAERDGAPLATVMTQLARDATDARRRLGEARARRLPVQLLMPLVCCGLPAVLVVTVVPLVLVAGGSLPPG
jgi:tight adherence protein C